MLDVIVGFHRLQDHPEKWFIVFSEISLPNSKLGSATCHKAVSTCVKGLKFTGNLGRPWHKWSKVYIWLYFKGRLRNFKALMKTKIDLRLFLTATSTIALRRRNMLCTVGYVYIWLCVQLVMCRVGYVYSWLCVQLVMCTVGYVYSWLCERV
jgi:hypothetical protein